jgi:cullin-associated NEDD8-dissociated protein 1
VQECNAQRVLSVKIYDPVANLTRYYTYVGLPCVRLTLFSDGRLVKRSNSRRQCADPGARVGYPVCCGAGGTRASSNYTSECLFANDVTDYATNEKRCAALNSTMCSSGLVDAPTWRTTCANNVNVWTNGSCSLQVQVYPSGQVSLVDPAVLAGSGGVLRLLLNSTNNVFRVRWRGNSFPAATAAGACPSGCQVQPTVDGDSCVCNFTVRSEPAFTSLGAISDPSNAVNIIAQRAHIGSVKPSLHDAGTYSRCTGSACTSLTNVVVWLHSGDNGQLSERTIFELPPFRRGGRVRYLMNRVSTVSVSASAAYAFRNPPRFSPLSGELYDVSGQEWTSDVLWNRVAENEVEALLEHLFEHDNTAVFVSYRLIQQMVTSNPSPRYVKEVVRAFRTGAYRDAKFSGRYGDLGATIYAILMDHEARSPIVEADPTFGMYRDPLVKLLHLMRSLDYQSPKQREVAFSDLDDRLGVQPFSAPSVFGFYLPEFRPAGMADEHGLVGPQLQLATTPNLIGFLNGLTSLIDNGLTSCENGLGVPQTYGPGRRCVTTGPHPTADGSLTYTAPINGTVNDLVDELNLVLTAGRLHRSTRETLVREYLSVLGTNVTVNTTAAALRHALKVLVTSAEFQTTSFNSISNKPRPEPAPVAASGRAFKAIVVVFEMGGADSFNKLVPHSGCTGKDLYAEYATVRAGAALDKTLIRQVSVPAGQQPCTVFGVHPAMSNLSKLYTDGDALFVANIGALVEPTTKEQYRKRTVTLPPSLFAHNIMQRSVQNVHAQQISAEGVLGRIMEAMVESDPPYASELFSLGGNVKMVQGAVPADFISGRSGVVRFQGLNRLKSAVGNMTRFTSRSVFAETYSDELMNSIRSTETLGALLGNTSLTATFGKSNLDQQMIQVAKLIKTLPGQGVERAAFFTQTGGFDTHDTFNLSPMFGDVDSALGSFMTEMKEQGRWGDVVVISVSDFARTLTSNGRGTDHGWGGIHWVAGGSVNGKQVLGKYPTTLTDESELSLGQGRLIPTTPFESVWNGIAEWFGVPASRIKSEVLPNVANFPASQIFTRAQMFRKA